MFKKVIKVGLFAFLLMSLLLLRNNVKADIMEGESIQVGENVTAHLSKAGVLTISGKGDMWSDTEDTSVYYNKWFNNKKNDIHKVVIKNGVTSIGRRAFCYMENLQSVSIPSTVNYIDAYAFLYTQSLRSVKIPSNVTKIGVQAFYESGIVSCTIGKGLVEIDSFAFGHCGNLTSVSIPKGTESVGAGAFSESGLKTVTIGENVGIIRENAFPTVNATIKSPKVIIGEKAFGPNSVFYAYKNSSADEYADINGLVINYLKDKNDKSKKLDKVKGVKASALSKGFRVKFNRIKGVIGYEIRYATNSSLLEASKATTIANIFNVRGLEGGKTYYIQVRAYTKVKGKKVYGKYSKIVKCKTNR